MHGHGPHLPLAGHRSIGSACSESVSEAIEALQSGEKKILQKKNTRIQTEWSRRLRFLQEDVKFKKNVCNTFHPVMCLDNGSSRERCCIMGVNLTIHTSLKPQDAIETRHATIVVALMSTGM